MIKILEQLVNIDSPSGYEERIRNYVSGLVKKYGFRPEIDDLGNLYVVGESDLWFVTHLDTVERKADFRLDGEYAYGTGVADAKGSMASILGAMESADRLGLNFAFLVDEEEGGSGSKHFSEYFSGRAVVMEPTNLSVAEKQLGSAEVVLKFYGKPVHGAYWNEGVNAIEKAIEAIIELKSKYMFSVQELRGGSNLYAIPDLCEVRLSFIFDFDVDMFEMRNELESLDADVEFSEFYEPIRCDEIPEIEKYAGEKSVMHSWTDAYNFKKNGWKVTIWGPGDLVDCHTDRERIKIDEIEKAAEIILKINEEVV
ncbi:M20/M25/M40 family metallo-hydrolase [Geoglobus acetivorans]|uniref:M20/M25/M40 family metallo-hydrolase n=1 Tax=Geoglobus acetivorans TaxID=565033 RepID=A0ABZ3H6U8_GEOAI|nr:M20/M25/M40 family metallo-hydrolase [Geoglobus acetivorans]